MDAEGEFYRLFVLGRKERLRASTRWTSASFKKVFTLIYPLMHTRGRSSHHSDSRSSGRTVATCPCAGNQTLRTNAEKKSYRKSSGGTRGTGSYSRSARGMKGRWSQFPGCRQGHPARTHEKMIKFSFRSRFSVWKSGRARCSPSSDRAESCLLYTSPSPRDGLLSRMPSSA